MSPTSALLCLALNIYHEARGEPHAGQVAVAMVTMNRAQWAPDKVCEVVYEPKQFSWTLSKRHASPQELDAWDQAQVVAKNVLEGNHTDTTDGATHFHAYWVQPPWSQVFKETTRIGDHIFYTQI